MNIKLMIIIALGFTMLGCIQSVDQPIIYQDNVLEIELLHANSCQYCPNAISYATYLEKEMNGTIKIKLINLSQSKTNNEIANLEQKYKNNGILTKGIPAYVIDDNNYYNGQLNNEELEMWINNYLN